MYVSVKITGDTQRDVIQLGEQQVLRKVFLYFSQWQSCLLFRI